MTADFPDWLSPMLVKELRQGLRSQIFLIAFLLLQGALIVLAISGLLEASAGNPPSAGIAAFYWMILGVPLILLMPLSGLNSIAGERKANTLELIFLSRLDARRIVLGKWLAIVAQTLLLLAAALPYAVLRYFFGSVDLARELTILAYLTLASLLLSALMVGISPCTNRIGRALVPLLFVFGTQILGVAFASSGFLIARTGVLASSGPSVPLATFGIVLTLSAIFLAYLIETGAGQIAPRAENHSTLQRLLALAALLFAILCSHLRPRDAWFWVIFPALLIIFPVVIGALCETVRENNRVYRPFVRFGPLGRLSGLILYPGWPSGVLFTLLTMALLFLHAYSVRPPAMQPSLFNWTNLVAFVGAIFLPAAFYQAIHFRTTRPILFYFLLQLAFALLAFISSTFRQAFIQQSTVDAPVGLENIAVYIPTSALCLQNRIESFNATALSRVFIGNLIVTLLSLLVLFIRMVPFWKTIRTLEQAARPHPGTSPASAPTSDVPPTLPAA